MQSEVTYFAIGTTISTEIEYTCKLVEVTEQHVGRRHDYIVTDIVVFSNALGYRRFTVAVPAGISLYQYLSIGNRRDRLSKITFKLTVLVESQRVTSVKALDPVGWVGGDIVH